LFVNLQVVALCEALRGSVPARLVLSYNELGNTAAKALAQLLRPCSNCEDAAGDGDSSSSSSKTQGLLELELSSNNITAEGAAALADALAQQECTLQVGAAGRPCCEHHPNVALPYGMKQQYMLVSLQLAVSGVLRCSRLVVSWLRDYPACFVRSSIIC
jgi:hypothetical protein